MARQKGQKMRFSDVELGLMKSLFAGNEDLFFLIRKAMLGMEMPNEEKIQLMKFMKPEVTDLIEKIFLPVLDGDAPMFQMTDLVNGLGADIKQGKNTEEMLIQIDAKEIEIDFLSNRISDLRGSKTAHRDYSIDELSDLSISDKRQAYVNVIARNYLLSYVDSNLQQVKFLAGEKEETVEETMKRLAKDSSK